MKKKRTDSSSQNKKEIPTTDQQLMKSSENERGEDAINFRPSIGNRRRSQQQAEDIGSDARVARAGGEVLERKNGVIASQVSPDTASQKALARFGDLTGMLEVPQYYTGKYRGKFTGLKKWLNGVAVKKPKA